MGIGVSQRSPAWSDDEPGLLRPLGGIIRQGDRAREPAHFIVAGILIEIELKMPAQRLVVQNGHPAGYGLSSQSDTSRRPSYAP